VVSGAAVGGAWIVAITAEGEADAGAVAEGDGTLPVPEQAARRTSSAAHPARRTVEKWSVAVIIPESY
jgi:hypothetical protein